MGIDITLDYTGKKDAERKALQEKAEADAASAAVNQQKAYGMQMENEWKEQVLKVQQEKLVQMEQKDAQNQTYRAITGAYKDGNYNAVNRLKESNPQIKAAMENSMNAYEVFAFDPHNENHTIAYRKAGMPDNIREQLFSDKLEVMNAKAEAARNGTSLSTEMIEKERELNNIAMAYPIVRGANGELRVEQLGDFVGASGILKNVYSDTDQKEIYSIIENGQMALQGVTKRVYESKLAKEAAETEKLKIEAGKIGEEARTSKLTNDRIQAIMDKYKDDPNGASAAMQEIQNILKPPTPTEKIAMDKYSEEEFTNIVKRDPKILPSIITSPTNDSKIKVGGKEISAYEAADRIQGTTKPSDAEKTEIVKFVNILNSADSVLSKLKSTERNAWEKVQTAIGKVVGTDLLNMSEINKNEFLAKVSADSEIQLLVSDYIKLMSGTAASEAERDALTRALTAGNYSTKESAIKAMETFKEKISRDSKTTGQAFASFYPKTALDLRANLKGAKPSASQPTEETKPKQTITKAELYERYTEEEIAYLKQIGKIK
jgi:phosphopantetheinyl transferase (holo-ACP synthase)